MGGTVTVAGFPTAYALSDTYEIRIGHDGGDIISNFNASVRIGTGSSPGGLIIPGYRSSVYNVPQETNGVRFSWNYQDSCTFYWVAPDSGIGEVRLYVAACQSHLSDGPNTEYVLVAVQGGGVSEGHGVSSPAAAFTVRPTVVVDRLVFHATLAPGVAGTVMIIDPTGRIVHRMAVPASDLPGRGWSWTPVDRDGTSLTRGAYFAVLDGSGEHVVRRFIVESD
jgi:hypothetical protein